MSKLISIILNWLPFAVTITLVCGIIYITVQQNYRENANDAQFQMTEDAVYLLNNGGHPKSISVGSPPVELSQSLSPWLIIYDDKENPVISGAVFHGQVPKLPAGVFDHVRRNGEHSVTWQPEPGVRQALVIRKSDGNNFYFAVSGRSLRKVEERVGILIEHLLLGWICSLGILFIAVWAGQILTKTGKSKE